MFILLIKKRISRHLCIWLHNNGVLTIGLQIVLSTISLLTPLPPRDMATLDNEMYKSSV